MRVGDKCLDYDWVERERAIVNVRVLGSELWLELLLGFRVTGLRLKLEFWFVKVRVRYEGQMFTMVISGGGSLGASVMYSSTLQAVLSRVRVGVSE